jgi:hypothetical protein
VSTNEESPLSKKGKPKNPENVKRGRRSKQKGGRGEREAVAHLKLHGVPSAFRKAQRNGKIAGDADVEANPELTPFHLEVKRNEALNLWEAYNQAVRDAEKTEKIPVVMHRRNKSPWLVTMDLGIFVQLALTWTGHDPIYPTVDPTEGNNYDEEPEPIVQEDGAGPTD